MASLMGTVQMKEVQHKDIIDLMFGEVKIQSRPKDIQVKDEIVMEVKGLSREKWYKDVNFTLRRGEVLGIAGMLGSGAQNYCAGFLALTRLIPGKSSLKGKHIKKPTR